MENPIKAIEHIPGDIRNWVNRELQKAEITAKIDALKLADWASQKARDAEQVAIADAITSLRDQLGKL